MLAHFADAIRPQVRQISDESSRQLEDLVARRRQISDMITEKKIVEEAKLIRFKPISANTLNGWKNDSKKLNPKSN